jgi:hypothetical protein
MNAIEREVEGVRGIAPQHRSLQNVAVFLCGAKL